MHHKSSFKGAFTLIEVMVAVMIISVVIMALVQMYSNNTHIFLSLKKQTKINKYTSFFTTNKEYGWENDEINLYRLLEDFDVETDLRKKLKEIKINLIYKELKTLDMSEADVNNESMGSSGLVFEIGSTILKTDDSSTAMKRFKIQ